ncbi:WD repeat-containing protein 18 isoform X2 [Macrobrachium rosenbergii]
MEPLLDGVIVASQNSGAECVQVYDAGTGTLLKSYRGTPCAYSTLCTLGNREYLLSAQRDKPLLQAWIMNQYESLQLRLVVPGKVSCMDINCIGPKYCVIGIDEKVYLYKLTTGRLLGVACRHYQPVTCLKFTPCGNYFASGGEDGFVYLWAMSSFVDALHKHDSLKIQPHFTLGQHSDKVTGLTITSSGTKGFLVSSSLDHTARVFDLVTGETLYDLVTDRSVTSIACNTLGSQIFLGHDNGTAGVVNLLPHPPIGDVEVFKLGTKCHEDAIRCIAVTTSGNQVITGGDDGEVKVWSLTNVAQGTTSSTAKHPHFALQRLLHTGRGPVTNLMSYKIDRETLGASELNVQEVLAPFVQDQTSPFFAAVVVPIRGRGQVLSHEEDLFYQAADIRSGVNTTEGQEECLSDVKSMATKLKSVNSELYRFAVKSILGD